MDAFVKSIQSFIDETIMTRVHLITYNFVPLTNIDVYFMRAIEQLLDNCIYDNNGLLITFIFQNNVDKNSLIFELQELIKNKVTDEISQKRIQTNTIIIKYDERGQFNKSVK